MSFTIWFTGLPGSGKSTLSHRIYQILKSKGVKVELMDGDVIRSTFAQELGFSKRDRDLNAQQIAFVSRILNKNEVVSIVAAITPYASTRFKCRQHIERYVEVFCNCPIEVAEKRDVKGLYALARTGKIKNFTGVSDPYEEPHSPEIVVNTDQETYEESVVKIIICLEQYNFI